MILNMFGFILGLYLKHTTDSHKHFVTGSRYDIMISVIFAASITMSLTNFLGIVVCSCALITSGRGGCGSWLAMQMILLFLFAWLLLASGVLMLLVCELCFDWLKLLVYKNAVHHGVCVCVRACVHACVRVCVRACVRNCVCARARMRACVRAYVYTLTVAY